jgi:hypothetical protein
MNKVLLFNEIDALPLDLQKQVADFVAFLKLKYLRQQAEDFELTDEELEELERRWEEYDAQPDTAIDVADFKKWMTAQYGI